MIERCQGRSHCFCAHAHVKQGCVMKHLQRKTVARKVSNKAWTKENNQKMRKSESQWMMESTGIRKWLWPCLKLILTFVLGDLITSGQPREIPVYNWYLHASQMGLLPYYASCSVQKLSDQVKQNFKAPQVSYIKTVLESMDLNYATSIESLF